MGQRIHAIFMYLNPLTFERSIVKGGKHDRLIPMGTRITPKPPVCVGKVVGFDFLTIIRVMDGPDTDYLLTCRYATILLLAVGTI